MLVKLNNFKRDNHTDRHGWKIDFKIDHPLKKMVIYQNVHVEITSIMGNINTIYNQKYEFTEAWIYKDKKKITDSFLIPIDWRRDQVGTIKIKTEIWCEEGNINCSLKKGTNNEYWGNLHGSFTLLKCNPNIHKITERYFEVNWNNFGKKKLSNFTRGKDLNLIKNKIDNNN